MPKACRQALGMDDLELYPHRYFVNITSQVLFYKELGVDISIVVVVRDTSMHFQGILETHNSNETAALEQFRLGHSLIDEALNHPQIRPHVTLISYETLMMLQGTYLLQLYDELGINSTFAPHFKDGNVKYLRKGLLRRVTVPTELPWNTKKHYEHGH